MVVVNHGLIDYIGIHISIIVVFSLDMVYPMVYHGLTIMKFWYNITYWC